jgi:hypothetical protein
MDVSYAAGLEQGNNFMLQRTMSILRDFHTDMYIVLYYTIHSPAPRCGGYTVESEAGC